MNPLSRLLAAIVAVLALVGAFFFGVFVLAFAAVLGLLAWAYLSIRMWWMRRKGGLNAGQQGPASDNLHMRGNARGEDIIDAEYTVVKKQDEES
jgi:hypothetical protein